MIRVYFMDGEWMYECKDGWKRCSLVMQELLLKEGVQDGELVCLVKRVMEEDV